jgi:hypothetical protein
VNILFIIDFSTSINFFNNLLTFLVNFYLFFDFSVLIYSSICPSRTHVFPIWMHLIEFLTIVSENRVVIDNAVCSTATLVKVISN